MKAMRQYADFDGRARRTEFWMFAVFYAIALLVAGLVDLAIGFPALMVIVALAHVVPGLAVTVRRLHDTDRSGAWWFIGLVPFGGIALIVFEATEGTRGPNQYGMDPKQLAAAPMGYPQPGQPYVA